MKALEYLEKLNDAGYESYIVGGFVRDYLLNIKSTDIDITTSATPDEVKRIFNITEEQNSGCIKIEEGIYHIDITTFRKESSYFEHTPRKIKYIKSLSKDLKRRDFTINAICMDYKGQIIDLLNGKKDLDNGIIRVIGSINNKFRQDPLRMIRALRIMIDYDFKIEEKAFMYILKHKNLFNNVSQTRKKEELERIFLSKNVIKGLEFLKNMNLLSIFNIEYDSKIIKTTNTVGMWAQIKIQKDFPFTKYEKKQISAIGKIVSNKTITALDIYKYDYECIKTSSTILGISMHEIENITNKMNIHHGEKLAITGDDIKRNLPIDEKKIKTIKEDLIYQLLSGNLSNEKNVLMRYVKKYWK